MDFVNKTLVKLSNAVERDALLNNDALKNILSAAYDVDRLPISGPYKAMYDEYILGYASISVSRGEGKLSNYNNNEYTDISLKLNDFMMSNDICSDILWRGSIIARSAPSNATIEKVKFEWKTLSKIDENIVISLGSLPTDQTVLESERRKQFSDLLKKNIDDSNIITDTFINEILTNYDAKNVSSLIEKSNEVFPSSVSVKYTDDPGLPPTTQVYPISALILICEDGFSIRDKLIKTKLLLKRMDETGIERAEVKELYPLTNLVAIWVVNESVFDDQDWPGGDSGTASERREKRKQHALKWLRKEGISIITMSSS